MWTKDCINISHSSCGSTKNKCVCNELLKRRIFLVTSVFLLPTVLLFVSSIAYHTINSGDSTTVNALLDVILRLTTHFVSNITCLIVFYTMIVSTDIMLPYYLRMTTLVLLAFTYMYSKQMTYLYSAFIAVIFQSYTNGILYELVVTIAIMIIVCVLGILLQRYANQLEVHRENQV